MSTTSKSFSAGDDPTWDQMFAKHAEIERIELEELADGEDLTVYYLDSDSPFPITSLTGETRKDLETAWDVYCESQNEQVRRDHE